MVNDRMKTIDYIKQNSRHYVPEWSFNEENPDLGASFAAAFAQMMDESLLKYDKLLHKHYLAFLNCLGMEPLPPQSAAGYVTFKLAGGAPHGELVPVGTVLYNEENDVPYMVDEDLFVTPAVLKEVYYGFDDKIFRILDVDGENSENTRESFIFHAWAFGQLSQDSTIELDFGQKITADLVWTYSGNGFEPFGKTVYANDKVYLTIGENKFLPAEVYGYTGFFIRAAAKTAADFSEMDIAHIKTRIFADNVQDKYLFHRDMEILQNVFYPFGKTLMPYDCFYIACDEAFSKKGAQVTIKFQINTELFGIFPSEENLNKTPAKKIEQISVDYWNGKDFVTLIPYLKDSFCAEKLFCPDQQENEIIFNCPADMENYIFNGIENRWLRIRILELSPIYQGSLFYEVPVLNNIKISYDCILKDPPGVMLRNDTKITVLIKNEKSLPSSEKKSLAKPNLFLGFDKPFGGQIINFLVKPDVNETAPEAAFYIFTANKRDRLTVIDKTENLSTTGIITLVLNEQPQLRELFGKKLYWLLAEFENDAAKIKKPPLLSSNNFFINAAPITQKKPWQKETFTFDLDENHQDGLIELKSSVGAEGNCAANLITQMPASLGYVQYVTNPFPVSGGRSLETAEQMINRRTKRLRHRQRAVTTGDFEALAYEYAGGLLKCRCYEKNGAGEDVTGHVTIVYIPQNYPQADEKLSKGIRTYLLERSHPMFSRGSRLTVREAVYAPVSITLTIVLALDKKHVKIQEKLQAELNSFLNPITGNFKKDGFDFGEFPQEQAKQLEQMVKQFLYSLPDVDLFENFSLEYTPKTNGSPAYTVLIPGNHTIGVRYTADV